MFSIYILPPEIINIILSYLDFDSWYTIRQTNSTFYRWCDNFKTSQFLSKWNQLTDYSFLQNAETIHQTRKCWNCSKSPLQDFYARFNINIIDNDNLCVDCYQSNSEMIKNKNTQDFNDDRPCTFCIDEPSSFTVFDLLTCQSCKEEPLSKMIFISKDATTRVWKNTAWNITPVKEMDISLLSRVEYKHFVFTMNFFQVHRIRIFDVYTFYNIKEWILVGKWKFDCIPFYYSNGEYITCAHTFKRPLINIRTGEVMTVSADVESHKKEEEWCNTEYDVLPDSKC